MNEIVIKNIGCLLDEPSPYSLSKKDKNKLFEDGLKLLTDYHSFNCKQYEKLTRLHRESDLVQQFGLTPSLAVRLFKEYKLKSITDANVVKTLTSSGTTGQKVSKIYLDRITANLQTKVLVNIMQSYLGRSRLPMLIIDHPGVVKDRTSFSARGAGILGLSTFGRKHTYALDENMEINFEAIDLFLKQHNQGPIFVFGFTFMVWQYFVEKLKATRRSVNLNSGILIHSGGWKKLEDKAVSNEVFKNTLLEYANVSRVHNFYGMVEQVGSIFVECEHGVLHAPNFSQIRMRRTRDWSECEFGEEGVVEVDSLLPISYPGHRLLTEDLGTVIGEDDCKCGRLGRYFKIRGRVPKAEIRGCSDTHNDSKGKR
ncbi:LuxE/PaaK family acyltransferase [Aliikangiella sp. IMCC44653]